MINTPDIERPPKQLIETLSSISSATAAGELCRLGIRDPQILGPVPRTPGKSVVGPALTLQFMPKREDIYAVDEYNDPEKQLHRLEPLGPHFFRRQLISRHQPELHGVSFRIPSRQDTYL